MRRLDRAGLVAPASWAARVAAAFPPELVAVAQEFERLALNCAARRGGFVAYHASARGHGFEFKKLWGEAKKDLARISSGHCAYCEGEINAARAGHVEHFKPKALFPTLAYEWDNYFLGCAGCNGAKSDKWPARGGYLRPDRGAPEKALRFDNDGKVSAFRRGAAEATIRDFDLSREWLVQLRESHIRIDAIEPLRDLLRVFSENPSLGRALIERLFARLKAPERAYSVALMQCARKEWASARRVRSRRR